jgi:capsular polysaccharide biosynthesis protein
MSNNHHSSEDREVKMTTEARQGEVSKGAPMKWVLIVSTVLAALALLIVYLFFVAA